MTAKRLKRPRDPIRLGKLIGDILTGQVEDKIDDGKNAAASEIGRLGGAAPGAPRKIIAPFILDGANLSRERMLWASASLSKASQDNITPMP